MSIHAFTFDPLRWLAVAAATLALGGCGGGGGGGDGGSPPPGSVDVTAGNQDQLSRAAVAAAQGGFVPGAVPVAGGGGSLFGGRARALSAARSGAGLEPTAAAVWWQALQAGTGANTTGRARPAALIGPTEDPCLVSGSTVLTIDDRDNNLMASAGDVLTVVFKACSDVAGETLGGTMSLQLTQVTRSPRLSFAAAATLTGLSITLPGHTARYDGDFTMSYAEPSATLATTRMVVGKQLAVHAQTVNFDDTFTLRAGLTIDSNYDAAALPPGGTVPGLTTTTSNGSVAAASAGGYVSVTTLAPLLQYDVDAFPRSGHFDVVGKNGSLQLTVLAAGKVRIDLDANGDGTFDQTKTVDWDWIF